MSGKSDVSAEVRWLIDELADPLVILPLQNVAKELSRLLTEAEQDLVDAPAARKYWNMRHEQAEEVSGLLLGTAFVVGQGTLAQTASIVLRLRSLTGQFMSLPNSREAILDIDAPMVAAGSLSALVIVDTAANYFKHYHEWPRSWASGKESPRQSKTKARALRIGMREPPSSVAQNLQCALSIMGGTRSDVSLIGTVIQDWRKRLAVKVSLALGLPAPDALDQVIAQGSRT